MMLMGHGRVIIIAGCGPDDILQGVPVCDDTSSDGWGLPCIDNPTENSSHDSGSAPSNDTDDATTW